MRLNAPGHSVAQERVHGLAQAIIFGSPSSIMLIGGEKKHTEMDI